MKVVGVVGPTATGKSDVAFNIACRLDAEIINFDSIQVYKGFEIGAAKPPLEMRKKILHHLMDEINPTEPFTAGDFRRRALEILQSQGHKKYVILVGGTGFYLQALLRGMHESSGDPQIKSEIMAEGVERGLSALYDELKAKDPKTSQKIHPHDRYRIVRALEILRSGKVPSEIQSKFQPQTFPYPLILFGLRRKKQMLSHAIEARTQFMLSQGLLDETRLLRQKYSSPIKGLESVGYKEAKLFLEGQLTNEELYKEIVKNTLHLAKRQATWFKREKSIRWLDPDMLGLDEVCNQILKDLGE